MSRNFNNNASVKKFCKVCQDAGKSETEYLSHFTRESPEQNSKVICPTLLALECRFCYKNGHTVKYCPVLKEREKNTKRAERTASYAEQNAKLEQKTKNESKNAFLCLDCDSDEEEEENVSKTQITKVDFKNSFPQLCDTVKPVSGVIVRNYALALAKAAPSLAPILAPIPAPSTATTVPVKSVTFSNDRQTFASVPAPWDARKPNVASKINWAAMDDDDDDDDEDDEDDDTW